MHIRSRKESPLVATFFLVALMASYYAFLLPVGSLQHADEYLTLDRAASFLQRDDWLTVFSNNAPTFKKPPLQYWMSAGLLAQGLDIELAVRLPSFLFGLGLLAATAWLARIVLPTDRWVMPAAVLLLACSPRFWQNVLSGLLDIGSTFFAIVALTATLLAVRQPRWWWVVALACGLGALQKAPTPLLFAAIPVIVFAFSGRWSGVEIGESLKSTHFAAALVLAFVFVSLWPALQWLRHGAESFEQAYMHQMVERFSPFGDTTSWARRSLFTLLLQGEPIPRLLGLAALVWLPFGGRRRNLLALPMIIALYALVALFSTGIVSPRYSLLFLPMMMVALAAAVLTLIPSRAYQLVAILLVSAIALGPFKPESRLGLTGEETTRLIPIMRNVAAAVRAEETLVHCGRDGEQRLPRGALAYYGSAGKSWVAVRRPEQIAAMVNDGTLTPPLRGLCTVRQYESMVPFLADPQIVEEFDGHVHWTAQGIQPGS